MSLFSSLSFVKKYHENDDIYTFFFSTKKNPNFRAGQHGLFLLPGAYRPHPFSISSSPDEELVSITTHTATGSRFKKRLMRMKPGNKIIFVGPILNFTFMKDERRHVLLAQGIGITPFRSMLVYAHSRHIPIESTLVHVDNGTHTFRKLTRECSESSFYPTSSEEFYDIVKKIDIQQVFYISGSPKFIRSTRQLLATAGVKASRIKTDSFLGY